MSDHRVYRDYNNDLGNHLLILRTRTALTQIALAEQIGVHRHSVQRWETGLSYPKPELLQRLIAVFLRHQAFTPGNERAEALALWEQAARDGPHPLPPFDEVWFARTLALQNVSPLVPAQEADREGEHTSSAITATQPATSHAIMDWGEAIAVPTLYGRADELQTLQQWVIEDHCRLVVIVGIGGMGKSSLAITFAQRVVPQFEFVVFRSLQNGPPLAELLDQIIRTVSNQHATPPDQVSGKIALLTQLFRERRCLLILDNLEAILEPGALAGTYRTGYAEYGALLHALSEREHHSCVVLTSREKPAELGPLEGHTAPVRSLQLSGLDDPASQSLLAAKDIAGTASEVRALARLYGGNPLALQLIAEPIRELFGGDVAAFLAMGDAFFNGVGQLLAQQFGRSTPLEQAILNWLAIEREPVSLSAVLTNLSEATPQRAVLAALESLRRRLLIERAPDRAAFTLQPVILEYVTDQLAEAIRQELVDGQPRLLQSHALVQATAKEYVRRSQEQLIGAPILQQLKAHHAEGGTEQRLLELLEGWRAKPAAEQGYGPGNVVNLLRLLRGHLRELDLSRLYIRQAYLAEVDAQDASLVDAHLAETVLAEAFDVPGSVALSGDGALLAAGTTTGQVWLWRVADRTPLLVVQGHTSGVWGVALSVDSQLLASASEDGSVRLWEASTGRPLATLQGHTGSIWGVALSGDGHLVASGGADGTVRLWEAGSGRLRATLQGHTGAVWSVALSDDGHLVVSGGFDGTVRLWEAGSGRLRATLQGHSGGVWSVALSGDGLMLASGGFEGTVRLWEAGSGRLLATLQGHTGGVRGVALSGDGHLLASGGFDGTARLWEAGSGRLLATLQGHTGGVRSMALSGDGHLVASGGVDGMLRLWEASSGRLLVTLPGHTGAVTGVALSGDGHLLASGGVDGMLRLWEASSGRLLATLQGHSSAVWSVALSGDGHLVASGGADGTARLWEAGSGRLLATLQGHSGAVWRVALSADGQLLVSGGEDGTVRLWEAGSGRLLATLQGHSGGVRGVALSGDGHLVASGGEDGTARLWEASTGRPLATLQRHMSTVWNVALSGDGHLVASGGVDGTVKLWEAGSGRLLVTLPGHTGGVLGVVLSGDGHLVASGDADGTVRLWEASSGAILHTLRPERRYERMDITDLTGITAAQRASLRALGAVERPLDRASALATTPHPTVADQPARGEQHVASSLPSESTSFIGRSAELTALTRRLADPHCRLLTLLGPGGIGKTRLALAVAAAHTAAFPDGGAFVPLAAISMPNQIISAIGEALRLSFIGHSDPTSHLLNELRARHMLLVLDSFEHLLAGADVVSDMLAHAPHVTVVVTSRERLNLQAEWLFDVDGLAYPHRQPHVQTTPQRLATLTEYSAVELFVQRARQVQPDLALDDAALTTIVRICQHVAGMPLAIELAAAGVHTLPLAEIERQIRANLDMLATSLRDVPTRHRSMRAVFDHSWRLLNEEERALFSHLAVFRGGWTAEAAEQVAGATIDVLTALVDKSLVRVSSAATRSTAGRAVSDAAAEPRYTMLEPIREYAVEQLVARGEAVALQRAHATYYLALAEAAVAQWESPTADVAIAQLDREYDNLCAVLRWARDGGESTIGLQLAAALRRFWQRRGYYSEGRAWLEDLLARDDAPSDTAAMAARQRALHAAAWLVSDQHDFARARQLFEQSSALRRALGEYAGETQLLLTTARQARAAGQYQRATALFEAVLARHRAMGNRESASAGGLGQSLYDLALVRREQGDVVGAIGLLEEGLDLHRTIGEREGIVIGLLGLGDIARDQGDVVGVRTYTGQSLAIARELGIQWAIGFALNNLALAEYFDGHLTRARALVDESVSLFRSLKADGSLVEVLITLGKIVQAQGDDVVAYAALTEALRLAEALGPRLMVAAALEGLASVVVAQEHAELAARLLAAASALRVQMGTPVRPVDHAAVDQSLAIGRAALGADAFAAVWAEGQALRLEQILNTLPSAAPH